MTRTYRKTSRISSHEIGHDVLFVPRSDLASSPDSDLVAFCARDGRYLITLDKGVPDEKLQMPTGVVLIRAPRLRQPEGVTLVVRINLDHLTEAELQGKITVLEAGGVRTRPMPES